MNDQLESRLRGALSDRAAQVPADSVARVAGAGYRPRARDLRPPLALAAAAVVAAGVVAIVSLSAGASNAFAGWSATPSPPAPGQLSAAVASCKAHSPVAGLPLQVTDSRGPFTFSVYAAGDSTSTCITGPSFTAVSSSQAPGAPQVSAGHVQLSSSHLATGSGQAYSFADGHAGSGVSAVTLVLDDATKVQATVSNGWFVAWWPGAQQVKSAQITTPSGVTDQTFAPGSGVPCGPGTCERSSAVQSVTRGQSAGQVQGSSFGTGPSAPGTP